MKFPVFLFFLIPSLLFAQTIDLGLPELSPRGNVQQVCGLTNISLNYGSPAVKGRKIWGGLVPYGEVWRMGANSPTLIEFSKAVQIEGTRIEAGKYAMHAFPISEGKFDLALSTNTSDWTDTTKEIIRFSAQLRTIPFTERLRFTIRDFTDQSAIVALQWESLEIFFSVELNTKEQVENQFLSILQPSWEIYAKAAQYSIDVLGSYQIGKSFAVKAYEMEKNFLTNYLMGLYFYKVGDQNSAKQYLNKSLNLGKDNPQFSIVEREVKELLRNLQ